MYVFGDLTPKVQLKTHSDVSPGEHASRQQGSRALQGVRPSAYVPALPGVAVPVALRHRRRLQNRSVVSAAGIPQIPNTCTPPVGNEQGRVPVRQWGTAASAQGHAVSAPYTRREPPRSERGGSLDEHSGTVPQQLTRRYRHAVRVRVPRHAFRPAVTSTGRAPCRARTRCT